MEIGASRKPDSSGLDPIASPSRPVHQRLVEEQLRESELRYANLVDNLDGIVWEVDAQTMQFRFVSRQAERILGFPVARWLEDAAFWQERIHPEDRAWAVQYCLECTQRGEGHDFEYRMLAADGRVVWLHDVVSVEMADGQPATLRGVMVDVTARKQAEATLRKSQRDLVASQRVAKVGSWELALAPSSDVDPNPLFWSDETFRLFGYESQQFVPSSEAFFARVHPDDRPRVREAVQQALENRSDYEIEIRIILDQGVERVIQERAELVLDPRTGEPVKFIGVSWDVTEQRRIEEALAVQQMELRHASRLSTIGQMVASLSHEVAQPLAAIGNFAGACASILEPATKDDLTAEQWRELKEYLSAITRQNERCRGILQRLRDFSGRAYRLTQCDFNELVRDAAELAEHELRRDGVQLRFDLTGSLPPIHADRIQLQQVVVNLLTNARDAMLELPHNRRQIMLRSRAGRQHAMLEVEDRGHGLREEVRRRLFEPFFTTKSTGMGIGLSICQSIIQEHNGQIEAVPNRYGGATFRVCVPLLEEPSDA